MLALVILPRVEQKAYNTAISQRFRGYLPVVVDVETAGFNAQTDALLEIAAVILHMDGQGMLWPEPVIACHVQPFAGARIDPKALAFNGIDPFHPFREALPENEALDLVCRPIRQAVKASGCKRAILVGHNAFFDLGFVNSAVERTAYKRNPFHPFSTFDTVTLAGLAYGQTVLARAVIAAGIAWDASEAHSAIYDTQKTAELFCHIVNRWQAATDERPWLALPTAD
ncbi:MAG: ribonuclease T [Chromatiaceae bacterium]|nr:ribonuclease T [Chromatiaceae bacterium]